MNRTTLFSFIAGICFGVWPLLMQKSGLNGYMQALLLSSTLVVMVSSFAYFGHGDLSDIHWKLAGIAAVLGAVGTILYTSAISKALTTRQSLSTIVLIQVVVQSVVPVAWEAVQNKTMSSAKVVGCVLAIASLVCLTRK